MCGNPVKRQGSLFCSTTCRGRWRIKYNQEKRSRCSTCGNKRNRKRGKFCSRKCMGIWRKKYQVGANNCMWGKFGKNNPNWTGNAIPDTQHIRTSYKYKKWRTDVFVRDRFTCQRCGQVGGRLEVHHIKEFRTFIREVVNALPLYSLYDGAMLYTPLWDISNGITWCVPCHNLTKGRKKGETYKRGKNKIHHK